MAAPVRRPQFLLPWIAVCTVVLGVGLQTFAPERSRRGTSGVAAPRAPDDALILPLPARLEPRTDSLLVRDRDANAAELPRETEEDPARQNHLDPAEALTPAVGTPAGNVLAGQAPPGNRADGERLTDRAKPKPVAGGIERPARLQTARAAGDASLESMLPARGAVLRWRWSDPLGEPEGRKEPSTEPELVIVRVADDAYCAFLVLDESDKADANADDALDPDVGEQATHRKEEPETSHEPTTSGETAPRARWARWFAEQAPPRLAAAAPRSREELRALLERTLGEHKVRYLVAASRDLDAREAAELLGRLRRWALEQRAG